MPANGNPQFASYPMRNPAHPLRLRLLAAVSVIACGITAPAQVAIVTSYTQDFNALGTALPDGWGVWTSSTATGNGAAFAWDTAQIANNATANSTNYFRNLPGASQTWSAGLSSGSDRALGWRAGNAATRDGSITFTLSDTLGFNLSSLSFQLFTPNNTGTAATYQLQYQIGPTGTFSQLASVAYTNDTAQNPLIVTSITLTGAQLTALNNQSGQVTFRWINTAASGTTFQTLAIDNFAYTATAVPEPATYAVLLGALVLLAAARRRRWAHAGT